MRARLALVAAAVTAMVAIAFLVPLAGLVDRLAEDRAMTQAERDAQLVAQFVGAAGGTSLTVDEAFAAVTFDGSLGGRPISLLLPGGTALGAPASDDENLADAFAGRAIRVATDGGQLVAVPSVLSSGEVAVVTVFVADDELNEGVTRSWIILALLGTLLVLIAVAVTDRLARSMVAPVEALSAAAGRLAGGDLDAAVDPAGPPELIRVSEEFNRLTGQVRSMLQHERETAADLSHRLRTPLAALRLSVESLPETADRERLAADLDELERSITHVINESRRPLRAGAGETADLARVVAERHAFWLPLAEEEGRAATVEVPPLPVPVAVADSDLVAAVDALFGNVLSHTPPGTSYSAVVTVENGTALLAMRDGGPGFADLEVLERGRSTSGSTGLGLDIVRRTAAASGGSMRLSTQRPGGAVVEVRIPVVVG